MIVLKGAIDFLLRLGWQAPDDIQNRKVKGDTGPWDRPWVLVWLRVLNFFVLSEISARPLVPLLISDDVRVKLDLSWQ